jgi:hypothetical protein
MKLSRKKFLVYVNVAKNSEEYDWALTGVGTEELNVEYNFNKESVTDIYGVTRGSVKPGENTITVDSNMEIADDKLFNSLLENARNLDYNAMSQYDVLIVYGFIEPAGDSGYEAEIHKGCTVMLTSLGGSSDDLNAPYEITLSNDKIMGTVTTNDWRKAPTFTPSV